MLTPNVVPDFTALRVAVVGDLIADRYLFARPTRLSREAPVMVMRYEGEEAGAGGAANVARNLWAFGARTSLLGAIGQDVPGRELLHLLSNEAIDVAGVEALTEWRTPTKTRILGAEAGRTMHQVLRIDREPDEPLPSSICAPIADRVRALAGEVDALLISDYGYGVCDERVAAAAREVQEASAVVVLDPRSEYELFRGVTGLTPNLAELAAVTGRSIEAMQDDAEVTKAATEVLERFEPRWLLVTMGNRGMELYSREFPEGIAIGAAGSELVIDVTGAGDTAVSAFTLGLAAGLEGPRAMRLANAAAGVVVMENGTAVCTLSKLRSALPNAPQPAAAPAAV